jgi:hypothetical protein
MTNNNGDQIIGWRFKNITIPSGSYITNAFIKWTSKDTSTSAANWILQGQLTADASTFTTLKYNISGRARSNQVVQWIPLAWTLINEKYSSPDIKHLVQNIIDQPSWSSGNDVAFIMRGAGTREAWSYDGDPLKGAELIIQYQDQCDENGILYVRQNATGMQNGSSWTNAYRSFEQALDHAGHCPGISQIWLAEGTYTPFSEVEP